MHVQIENHNAQQGSRHEHGRLGWCMPTMFIVARSYQFEVARERDGGVDGTLPNHNALLVSIRILKSELTPMCLVLAMLNAGGWLCIAWWWC